jgi:MarR family transcriptional regulator for hemolysin
MVELEERFAKALHNTARAWRFSLDRRLKRLGLSQAGWMMIAVIAQARLPVKQSDLAEWLNVEGATVVSMVDRLVKAGLVNREMSITDRRVKHVVITEAGRIVYGKVKTEAAAFRKELLSDIEPNRLGVATELLEALQRMIETPP